ncbi:unnamed protein product [Closterium sp. NIES-65]|nr:unnamed protein product [Closterium sp. NIES-65]
MPTLPASADAAHSLVIASICRRWRRLAQRHVSTLLVKEDRVVSRQDVLTAVACFPNLTHLHLSDGSVETLDNSFLADLASSCPGLRALHVGKLMMAADDRQHGRRDRFITESGLDYFFRHCPQLEQLSLRLSSLTALSIEASSLHYDQLSSLLQLTNLIRLSLPDDIRVVSPDPPAFSLAQLPSLESLKFGLHGAQFSIFPPLRSPYSFLKRLQLNECFSQERIPDSVGEVLPRLQELSISGQSFRDLTDHFTSLTCLESLTISSGLVLTLPENFGNLPALKALLLQEQPLCHLPASFTRLASLESFCLRDCMGVEKLPAGFGNLTALQTLSLAWLMKLDLREDLGGLTNLQIFHLIKNREEQLPSSFTQLASLTRLELDRCAIAELPAGMAEMTNLQELHILKCPAFKELPECVTALTSLQLLRIQECRRLSSVPRRLDSLTRLKQLELRGCWLLREAPQALPLTLQALSYLENSQHVVSPTNISRLTELRILLLGTVRAPFLEAMGASLSGLSHVEHLEVGLGEDAEELLTVLTRLPRLHTLTLQEARSLDMLVESGGSALQELRQLNIRTMYEELAELPAAITTLHHLTSIQIHARMLSSLPDILGAFSRLRRLELSHCSSLTRLLASLTQLSCLHYLNLSYTSICMLPPNFARLSRLKKLNISNCKHLEALPDDIYNLRMLERFSTVGCDMLQR